MKLDHETRENLLFYRWINIYKNKNKILINLHILIFGFDLVCVVTQFAGLLGKKYGIYFDLYVIHNLLRNVNVFPEILF